MDLSSYDTGMTQRRDPLDPLPYTDEWPSLRSVTGRTDIHSLAAFFAMETKLDGDYLEFGVGKGRSAVSALRAEAMYRRDGTTFHLFDSFEGLPEIEGRDRDFNQFRAGDFAFSVSQVQSFIAEHGCSTERVRFHAGNFANSLSPSLLSRPAAIVHVDCDLYASTKLVLPFVTPRLVPGAIMLFDDWSLFAASAAHGERAAVKEWLAEHPEIALEPYAAYGWCGQAFIVQLSR